jgi:hypothetical protein
MTDRLTPDQYAKEMQRRRVTNELRRMLGLSPYQWRPLR